MKYTPTDPYVEPFFLSCDTILESVEILALKACLEDDWGQDTEGYIWSQVPSFLFFLAAVR